MRRSSRTLSFSPIEVKGTKELQYKIVLKKSQFRALREKKDEFFVYVVLNAFRKPILNVVRGSKLLEISDIQIMVPYEKWGECVEKGGIFELKKPFLLLTGKCLYPLLYKMGGRI